MFGFLKRKTIFLFIDLSSLDKFEFAIAKGNKIIKVGKCSKDELKDIKKEESVDCARIAILSELSYFDIMRISIKNKKFTAMAIKKYINEQSVFIEPYQIAYKEIEGSQDEHLMSVCAIPKSDIDAITSLRELFVVESIIPMELAIIRLAKTLVPSTERVIWANDKIIMDIEIQNNFVGSKSVNVYDAGKKLDMDTFSNNTLFLGQLSSLNKDREYIQDELHESTNLAHLYGLALADNKFNFIDNEYSNEIQSFKFSRTALFISIPVSLFIAFIGFENYNKYVSLEDKFMHKKLMLERYDNYVRHNMPKPDEIGLLSNISKLQKAVNNQLDLGKFLSWITHITPKGAIIASIDISSYKKDNSNKPQYGAPGEDTAAQSIVSKTQLSDKNFAVVIKLHIDGNYERSKHISKLFLKELSKKIKTDSNDFSYDEIKREAFLKTTFKVDGSRF